MAGPVVVVQGMTELRRAMRRIGDVELADRLKKINKDLAQEIVRRALPRVPVRTGRLRRSVRGLGNQSGAVGKAGGARLVYAPAIHWGWPRRGIEPRPFLKEAADSLEPTVTDRYFREIDGLFDAVRAR